MGLLRLLLLILVVVVVLRLVLRALRPPLSPPREGDAGDYGVLVRCTVCGTYIPAPQGGIAPVCERCRKP